VERQGCSVSALAKDEKRRGCTEVRKLRRQWRHFQNPSIFVCPALVIVWGWVNNSERVEQFDNRIGLRRALHVCAEEGPCTIFLFLFLFIFLSLAFCIGW